MMFGVVNLMVDIFVGLQEIVEIIILIELVVFQINILVLNVVIEVVYVG